ncbi:hypothetical protein FRC11_002793 [Ceratobasidium sp. 423]|nr:hypothetical protein FRC11_002793 [Ceratobasidium sp. 423]
MAASGFNILPTEGVSEEQRNGNSPTMDLLTIRKSPSQSRECHYISQPDSESQDEEFTLSRWRAHALSVHYLDVGPLVMTSNQYKILLRAACVFENPLLPNLRGLFMLTQERQSDFETQPSTRSQGEWEVCPANWTHAMHLSMLVLGPSLVELDLGYTGATFPDFDIVFECSPRLSILGLVDKGGKPDYRSNECNVMLGCIDEDSENLKARIGYAGYTRRVVPGPPGSGEWAASLILYIPAVADKMLNYTSIRELTLVGDVMRNTNLFDIGHLPSLYTLIIKKWKKRVYGLNNWVAYEKYAGPVPGIFPLLERFSLLETGSWIADRVFPLCWMLYKVQHISWRSVESDPVADLQESYGGALGALANSASSLQSLELVLPGCTETPEQQSDLSQTITKLWPSRFVRRPSSDQNTYIYAREAQN